MSRHRGARARAWGSPLETATIGQNIVNGSGGCWRKTRWQPDPLSIHTLRTNESRFARRRREARTRREELRRRSDLNNLARATHRDSPRPKSHAANRELVATAREINPAIKTVKGAKKLDRRLSGRQRRA